MELRCDVDAARPTQGLCLYVDADRSRALSAPYVRTRAPIAYMQTARNLFDRADRNQLSGRTCHEELDVLQGQGVAVAREMSGHFLRLGLERELARSALLSRLAPQRSPLRTSRARQAIPEASEWAAPARGRRFWHTMKSTAVFGGRQVPLVPNTASLHPCFVFLWSAAFAASCKIGLHVDFFFFCLPRSARPSFGRPKTQVTHITMIRCDEINWTRRGYTKQGQRKKRTIARLSFPLPL